MPIDIYWLIPEHIIYARNYGVVSGDDLQEMLQQVLPMIENGVPLVHLISDGTNIEKHDFGIKDLREIFFNNVDPSINRGWTISITPEAMQRFFGALVTQFSNVRQRQTPTLEDALAFLAENDDTLPSYDEMMAAYHTLQGDYASQSPKTPDL